MIFYFSLLDRRSTNACKEKKNILRGVLHRLCKRNGRPKVEFWVLFRNYHIETNTNILKIQRESVSFLFACYSFRKHFEFRAQKECIDFTEMSSFSHYMKKFTDAPFFFFFYENTPERSESGRRSCFIKIIFWNFSDSFRVIHNQNPAKKSWKKKTVKVYYVLFCFSQKFFWKLFDFHIVEICKLLVNSW